MQFRDYPHIGNEGYTEKALREVNRTPNQSRHLRAPSPGGERVVAAESARRNRLVPTGEEGTLDSNLSYIDFIRVVHKLWTDAHPDIPLRPHSLASQPSYPCVLYSLSLRRTHPSEPKPRLRETINTGKAVYDDEGNIFDQQQGLMVYGWRFQNIVKFTVLDQVEPESNIDPGGAEDVERIIEAFEDFMHEHTPVFKFLGASEFVYNQRLADDSEDRAGDDIVSRSVNYRLTTEKIFHKSMDKIREICTNIRVDLGGLDDATPVDPSPYEPFYEEVQRNPGYFLAKGRFERPRIIDDQQSQDVYGPEDATPVF